MIAIATGLTLIFLGFFFARREAEKQQKEENSKRAKEKLEDARVLGLRGRPMAVTAQNILEQLQTLPPADRLRVVEQVVHEVAADVTTEHATAQSAAPLTNGGLTAWRRRHLARRLLIPAAMVVGVTTVAIGLRKRSQGPVARSTFSAQVPSFAASTAKSNDLPTPSTVTVPVKAPSHETVHLEIQVEPSEAELTLDGRAVGGNRLRAEHPKDRSIHFVRASAPGFVPFSQIVSFDNDVRLNIELRRARYPVQGGAKPHPQQIRSESKSDWKAMPQSGQVEEPGTNMEHPALRRASIQIDERDPYTP